MIGTEQTDTMNKHFVFKESESVGNLNYTNTNSNKYFM